MASSINSPNPGPAGASIDAAQETDPLNIDEATVATVGLTPALTGTMPFIGVIKQREILSVPTRIARLCDDLVNDKLPRRIKLPREMTYDRLVQVFTGPVPEQVIELNHAAFSPNLTDQAIEFTDFVQGIHKHLADMLPVQVYDSVLGPVPIEPPGDKLWEFYSRYWIANDPLIVLTLAQSGALLPEQVAVLAEFYPSLYEHVKTSLVQALTKRKLRDKSFLNLPPRCDRGVSVLLQKRIIEFGENTHQVQPDPIQAQAATGPVTSSKPNPVLQTPGQRATSL